MTQYSPVETALHHNRQLYATHEKILICTVGLPRSGKSTWAKSQGWPMVSPDSIRLALHGKQFYAEAEQHVWAIAHTMVRSLFNSGHKVVIQDSCAVTRERRQAWISSRWSTFFCPIDANVDSCLSRAEGNPGLISAIRRMSQSYTPLSENEPKWLPIPFGEPRMNQQSLYWDVDPCSV